MQACIGVFPPFLRFNLTRREETAEKKRHTSSNEKKKTLCVPGVTAFPLPKGLFTL
jgi:hypothetical protein